MDVILATIRHHAPAPAEDSAIRQLHSKEAELQRAKEKIAGPWPAPFTTENHFLAFSDTFAYPPLTEHCTASRSSYTS